MVKISKIYTKIGDSGKTQIVGGSFVSKSSSRISCVGSIDELNAQLGVCIATLSTSKKYKKIISELEVIQQELFDLGAFVACLPNKVPKTVTTIKEDWILRLENSIDAITSILPPLNSFILPSGNIFSAQLHMARCICRRAETKLVALQEEEFRILKSKTRLNTCQKYLNRLSDYFFALCRKTSQGKEILWIPANKRK